MYRAHFCGLSSCLHRDYGAWARCLVNRDSAFLALLGSALTVDGPAVINTTCCNPLGKKREMLRAGPILQYAAAVTICGLSTKLEDDANDERGARRWLAMAGREMLGEAGTTAFGRLHALGFHVDDVTALLRAQPQEEHSRADLASAAQPTCAAYGEIVAHLGQLAGAPSAALREIGWQLGFLVYTQDAWEDWAGDQKCRRFNPLHALVEENARRERVVTVMRQASERLRVAFDSLTVRRNRDLLRGVLVEGANRRVLAVSQSRADEKTRKRKTPAPREHQSWRCRDCCDCWGWCDCFDCCECVRCSPRAGGAICDCNPCDGDGCGCCGCDCSCN
ncbi:MAG: hypothetical protein JWL59_5019 [Chthoniobacteraceae bacterium]|nr:hypothetical protein [Chthoniobacteraceae bacterium]